MMKTFIRLIALIALTGNVQAQSLPIPYKNPLLSVEARTLDLIARMTAAEKVGQLLCPLGWDMYEKGSQGVAISTTFRELIDSRHVGMFWAVYRADPWTKKTLATGLDPRLAAETGNAMQRYVMEHTRLGIPLFLAEEMPHGHMAIGTTVFPTGIGLASTWNPDLVTEVAGAAAREVRLQGGHIGYGPVLDLARDPRWSRVEEGYGEDPVLSGMMGAAFVKGTGGGKIDQPHAVVATLKHFIAYGIPEGAHNGNPAIVGPRALRESFLPPFKAALDAGALSVMTAYNSIDGIPCTANPFLLRDVLRDEWNFSGFVVSDLVSIDGLAGSHRVAADLAAAGRMALEAGVDVDLGANAFATLVKQLQDDPSLQARIDEAVARVLRLKFSMGLFENPYVDPDAAATGVRTAEHVATAHKAARQSIVLLENKNGMLPLAKTTGRIAVIGPNADSRYNQLGDYTAPQDETKIATVLDGIRAKVPYANVTYVKGCAIRDTTTHDIEHAVEAARWADVAIVVVGGSSARDFKTQYLETGAAVADATTLADIESGEGFDRATLDLLGRQEELLRKVSATGTPTVVIYIQGRPLNMNWVSEHADALLTAWYPGQEGGHAVADVLFGDYNPAGRLPISVPRDVGQLPVYYNKKNPLGHDYADMVSAPLYPFGYGKSYTTFGYDNLVVSPVDKHSVRVTFSVTNRGQRDGEEVVQLYLKDHVASTVQPEKQLKHFARIGLTRGETKQVAFVLDAADFSIVDRKMDWTVEPGTFGVLVGASSNDIRLEGTINLGFAN